MHYCKKKSFVSFFPILDLSNKSLDFIDDQKKSLYINPVVSYLYLCNTQHSHLGRHRLQRSDFKNLKFMKQNSIHTYLHFTFAFFFCFKSTAQNPNRKIQEL